MVPLNDEECIELRQMLMSKAGESRSRGVVDPIIEGNLERLSKVIKDPNAKRSKAAPKAEKTVKAEPPKPHSSDIVIDEEGLKTLALQIQKHDRRIAKLERLSTTEAVAAGRKLLDGKKALKAARSKRKFQAWIREDCRVKYKRAYNYMRLAQAVETEPALIDLRLSHAFEKLGLLTRKGAAKSSRTVRKGASKAQSAFQIEPAKRPLDNASAVADATPVAQPTPPTDASVAKPTSPEAAPVSEPTVSSAPDSSDSEAAASDEPTATDPIRPTPRPVKPAASSAASCAPNVLELGANWYSELLSAMENRERFAALLTGSGLLLRGRGA